MAKLLIIGASRGIGRETVKAAVAAGHSVRALARSAWIIPIQNPGLEKVPGNALDSSTIRSVVEGVDVVVQTLGVDIAPRIYARANGSRARSRGCVHDRQVDARDD